MTNQEKANKITGRIYDELCKHYNAIEITNDRGFRGNVIVPMSIYNMVHEEVLKVLDSEK